jgi:hypothetical protein
MNILEATGVLNENDRRLLLGVTATGRRGDGQPLAKIYRKITYNYPLRKAIEDGWLVELRCYKVSSTVSLDEIKTVRGDYEQTQLAETVNTPERNQLVVKAWLEKGEGRQTVVYSVDIQHAKDLAETFRQYGVKAEALWGDDSERSYKLEQHRHGDLTVLVNCAILIEGYDDWRIGCIVPACPTKSPTKFAQMVGRGTRLQDGMGNLKHTVMIPEYNYKRDCIILDVVDNSKRHSLVTLPTLMGMGAYLDLHGQGIVASINKLEEAQKEFPHIDFSTLTDITQLQAHIESVNLFEYKFAADVERCSNLSWYVSPTGSYVLMLPHKDFLEVEQNLLDKWEIRGIINNKKYRGERDTIEEAFLAADDTVMKVTPDVLKLLRREEKWHSDLATPAQSGLLKKFYKGKAIPPNITKGMASRKIAEALAYRREKK